VDFALFFFFLLSSLSGELVKARRRRFLLPLPRFETKRRRAPPFRPLFPLPSCQGKGKQCRRAIFLFFFALEDVPLSFLSSPPLSCRRSRYSDRGRLFRGKRISLSGLFSPLLINARQLTDCVLSSFSIRRGKIAVYLAFSFLLSGE